jgi:hypothetical protein
MARFGQEAKELAGSAGRRQGVEMTRFRRFHAYYPVDRDVSIKTLIYQLFNLFAICVGSTLNLDMRGGRALFSAFLTDLPGPPIHRTGARQ